MNKKLLLPAIGVILIGSILFGAGTLTKSNQVKIDKPTKVKINKAPNKTALEPIEPTETSQETKTTTTTSKKTSKPVKTAKKPPAKPVVASTAEPTITPENTNQSENQTSDTTPDNENDLKLQGYIHQLEAKLPCKADYSLEELNGIVGIATNIGLAAELATNSAIITEAKTKLEELNNCL